MNFQKWTIGIFMIILVIILIYLGMNINTPNTSKPWPPLTANCPDYWADVNGDGSNCIATYDNNIGQFHDSTSSGSIFNILIPNTSEVIASGRTGYTSNQTASAVNSNFAAAPYIGANGTCAKYKWATTNKISWDGITYGTTLNCKTV